MSRKAVNPPTTEALISALRRPAAYPHDGDEVDFLQTHISLLFFAGDFVYKIKKPVDMGFLDYTTLEQRRHFCAEEVRLNRRLAPQTYLGVVAIRRGADDQLRVDVDGDGQGDIVEYAVRMKRLPADRMLNTLLQRGAIDNRTLDALARRLADFHNNAATGEGIDEYAEPAELRQQCSETFETVGQFAGDDEANVLSRQLFEHLRTWCMRFLDEHETLLHKRIEQGRIRNGHGDLHSGNICVLDDRLVIYDCIEFTPKFRCRDIAAELAFLAMDVDAQGCRGFGRYLLRKYARHMNDDDLEDLAVYYKTYLAIVRGMVAALKADEDEVAAQQREQSVAEARRYFALAASYTLEPVLIVMCGLPASGKSYVAKIIAQPFEAHVLRSDVTRKKLAGVATTDKAGDDAYDEQFSDRVFAELREQAQHELEHGRSVVIDATMIERQRRAPFIELGRSLHVPTLLVQVECDENTIRQRMAERAESPSASDADWDVYQSMRKDFEPPTEVDDTQRLRVQSPVDEAALVQAVLDRLADVESAQR